MFEAQSAVRSFITDACKNNLDLSDLLIAFGAQSSGCEAVLTFSKKAAKSNLVTLLAK